MKVARACRPPKEADLQGKRPRLLSSHPLITRTRKVEQRPRRAAVRASLNHETSKWFSKRIHKEICRPVGEPLARRFLQAEEHDFFVLRSSLGNRKGEKKGHSANDDFHSFMIKQPFAKAQKIDPVPGGKQRGLLTSSPTRSFYSHPSFSASASTTARASLPMMSLPSSRQAKAWVWPLLSI